MTFARRIFFAIGIRVTAALAAGFVAGSVEFASAQENYVVELFTSQGCSHSPRADQWLASIAQNPGVVAVTFPVSLWDYSGWRDTLASPAFTARQKAYAALIGDRRVYTPEVIIDGIAAAAGGDEAEIKAAIDKAKGLDGAMSVPMRLSQTNSSYSVEISDGSNGPAFIIALHVARTATVQILRGENAGKSLTYTNVVRRISKIGEWTGKRAVFDLPETPNDGEGFVVLAQKGTPERPGAIVAAVTSDGL
jgi:hypothetical protein